MSLDATEFFVRVSQFWKAHFKLGNLKKLGRSCSGSHVVSRYIVVLILCSSETSGTLRFQQAVHRGNQVSQRDPHVFFTEHDLQASILQHCQDARIKVLLDELSLNVQ